jgi:isoleucyl-tRNA synthetase
MSIKVSITAATGEKCPRCWNYRTLGKNPDHPEVCERCAGVLQMLQDSGQE